MRPNKPFVMPPVRIISPALEGQNESSKSLGEWLDTEETVISASGRRNTWSTPTKASPTVLSATSSSTLAS